MTRVDVDFYNTPVMLAYLMDLVSPDHRWKNRLKYLVHEYGIDIRRMGFPENPAKRSIWSLVWG
uniref:Uncharacterized protein n=1 Tax=Candidatus Kentrum sp. LFY TaxID=2126342 RepID=A0A450V466_9GAMM|nr:MAG: hypothetical protein BECKLFY1418A_GA0070994_102921 [Candidatus Kentron sp. LFY]VFJ99614.1 MAG: hypothetical protein BECKLFY1418B_GA0070995_11511 [Candidatus Kentron sp. LFY]